MIDYISLKCHIDIPLNFFSPMKWKQDITEDGQPFRWHNCSRVKLKYYEETHAFIISGKIMLLLHDTQVQNMDDIYGGHRELFIEELNTAINRLFPSPILDIRNFSVTRIDYCVNVETPHVQTYIDFLGRAFQMVTQGSRIDFTQEHKLHGSVYVRTKSDYENNSNKNYTVNFYDKTDQLKWLMKEGACVSEADQILAQNILRLEVQCGHQLIKRLTKKFCISNTFGDLLDFRVAYEAILFAYQMVFKGTETADFFTYAEAKSHLPERSKARDVLRVAASHKIMDPAYTYGRTKIKNAGVYPYCFLDKQGDLKHLPNPMKLIKDKFSSLKVL